MHLVYNASQIIKMVILVDLSAIFLASPLSAEAEVVPHLEDLKKLLTEKPSSGIKDEGKSGKIVQSDSKPPTVAKEDSVQKLLATSALRRQFKISGQIGKPEQKDKISFSLARQIQTGLARGYAENEIVDGVIRSITPGMVLRSYLETYKDLTLDWFEENSL